MAIKYHRTHNEIKVNIVPQSTLTVHFGLIVLCIECWFASRHSMYDSITLAHQPWSAILSVAGPGAYWQQLLLNISLSHHSNFIVRQLNLKSSKSAVTTASKSCSLGYQRAHFTSSLSNSTLMNGMLSTKLVGKLCGEVASNIGQLHCWATLVLIESVNTTSI